MLCDDADGRDMGEEDLDGPIELELIEQGVGRRGRRVAVLELEVAEPGLDRLRADPAMTIDAPEVLSLTDRPSDVCRSGLNVCGCSFPGAITS